VWLARRYRSAKAWFAARLWARLLLGVVLLTSPCWCGCGGLWIGIRALVLYRYWVDFTPEDRAYWRQHEREANPGIANSGLPSVGRRLKAEMEAVPDPDAATRLHPEWATQRFKNGEWVIWHSIASGNFRVGAGTAVVKDSTGRVRIFFGLVKFDNQPLSHGWESLKEYDDILARNEYLREWVPPP
jgi:hypothetical protein